jgi:chromosome segregation ATPase
MPDELVGIEYCEADPRYTSLIPSRILDSPPFDPYYPLPCFEERSDYSKWRFERECEMETIRLAQMETMRGEQEERSTLQPQAHIDPVEGPSKGRQSSFVGEENMEGRRKRDTIEKLESQLADSRKSVAELSEQRERSSEEIEGLRESLRYAERTLSQRSQSSAREIEDLETQVIDLECTRETSRLRYKRKNKARLQMEQEMRNNYAEHVDVEQ